MKPIACLRGLAALLLAGVEAAPVTAEAPAAGDSLYAATVFTPPGGFPGGIEGPAVDRAGNLYAVNFGRPGTIGMVTLDGVARLFLELPHGSTGNGLRFGPGGALFVADYTGHNLLRVDLATRAVSVFAHAPSMSQPNDLAVGADGRLYASDPDWRRGTGRLWRVDPDGAVALLESGLGTTNGIEVGPGEDRLYVGESAQRRVWVYDLSADGTLSRKRQLIAFDDHGLDGMRCDLEGNLYVTRHGQGTVAKVSPEGVLLREIELTGRLPSNIAFGGPDGRTAYVTMQDEGNVEHFRVESPGRSWGLWRER